MIAHILVKNNIYCTFIVHLFNLNLSPSAALTAVNRRKLELIYLSLKIIINPRTLARTKVYLVKLCKVI